MSSRVLVLVYSLMKHHRSVLA